MKRKRTFKLSMLGLALTIFLTGIAQAQDFTVSGTVTDATTGESMPGVNITVEGTTIGTITDLDGNYSIDVPDANVTLVFSYIGFLTENIPVNGQSKIDLSLIEDIMSLDELVVIGYGTQKKSDLTGAVAVVDVDEMTKTSNSNIGTLLQGRVAGVQVTTDGQPGADPVVRIRGIGTFSNSTPLYVIDGVPIESGSRDFSPSDIETMQILKDASAAAIYGSRAANGVIIITTKKGSKNTPLQFSYKGFVGFDHMYKRMPVLKRENYQALYNTSLINSGMAVRPANDPTSEFYIDSIDTDWQEEGFKTGQRHNHTLSMRGGGETGTYSVVLDYMDSEGTLVGVGPDYTRYSVRSNTTYEKKFFSGGTNLVYTHTDQNTLNNTGHSNFSGGVAPMVNTLTTLIPTMAVYDETTENGFGTYDPNTQGEDYSLNIIGVNSILEDIVTVDRMLANGYGMIKFGKMLGLGSHDLDYKINLSYDQTNAHDFLWIPAFFFSNFYTNPDATLRENWRGFTTRLVENTLTYNSTLFGKLNTNIVVGQTFQGYTYKDIRGTGITFPEPYYPKLSNATETSVTSYEEHAFLLSYLGRANLDYDNKYLLTGTIRQDITSRVSRGFRDKFFPSFSAGWKLHNEPFFPAVDLNITELKIRGGWGKLGNQAIGPYEYLATLNRNVVYNFDGEFVQGSTEADIFPDKLLWEDKIMSNIGFDLGMFQNKLTFTAEYYKSVSDGILVDVNIPLTVGSVDTRLRANAASIENKGLEFILGYRNYDHEFKYDISVNGTTIKNKVIELGNEGVPTYGAMARTIQGEEIGRHWGYKYVGIFQTQEDVDSSAFQTASTAPGDVKFADLNDDGIINDDDKTDLGSSLPSFTFGANFTCEYKNLDFTLFLNGATGFLVTDFNYRQLMHSGGGLNWHEDILDAWTPENTDTDIPRVVYENINGNGRDSDRPGWLQKGDYLKITNITLGYTFSDGLFKNTIKSFRVYATVQNLATLTAFKGFNPDFNASVWAPGFNYGSYPAPRTYMFGVNLDF